MDAATTEYRQSRREGDRRVRRTKRAVRDAVQRLLETQPYEKLTITAIAREADIDRKTFYLHYSSVDAVLDEIIQEEVDHIVGVWRSETAGREQDAVAADVLQSTIATLIRELQSRRDALRHIDTKTLIARTERPLIEAALEEDVLGIASSLSGTDIVYATSFLYAGMLAVLQRWLQDGGDTTPEELASIMTSLVVATAEGVSAEHASRAAASAE